MSSSSKKGTTFSPEEVELLVELVGGYLRNPSKLTATKRIFTKRAWDEVTAKFRKSFPHHSRKSIQKKWEKIKSSFAAWSSLNTHMTSSDVNGTLPQEDDAERVERMDELHRRASAVQKLRCIDQLSAALGGSTATGIPLDRVGSSDEMEDGEQIRDEGVERREGDHDRQFDGTIENLPMHPTNLLGVTQFDFIKTIEEFDKQCQRRHDETMEVMRTLLEETKELSRLMSRRSK